MSAQQIIEPVAGLQFYALNMVADALQQGIRLRWQRDPDNYADRNAISLWLDRDEARSWEILDLIPHNEGIGTWQIGHIPRGLAADLAPLLDEGRDLEVYVNGGTKDGAWSLTVRLEGAAVRAVVPARAARAADAKAEAAAVRAVERLRNEVYEGLDRVSRQFPGWDGVVVELEESWVDHRGRQRHATDSAGTPSRDPWWTADRVRRNDEAMRAPRRAAATAAFQPIIDAEIAREEEARERRRRAAAEKREAERRAEAARLVTTFNATGKPVSFRRGLEQYLPWLRRSDVEVRGLRPEHCRIAAEGTTAYGTPLYLYLPEIDPERVAAAAAKPKRKAPRPADRDDMPIPW